jgi:predicted negative regulator of RcsB-dependent stress response
MKLLFWIVLIAAAAGFTYWLRSWRRRQAERQRAAEQRLAALMAEVQASKRSNP